MDQSQIEDRFFNVSPETVAVISEYQRTHNPELVEKIVRGIVAKYLPNEAKSVPAEGIQSLNAFGLESITLMEVVLDIQDALGITLQDNELRALRSFDDTIALLSAKVAKLAQSSPAA